MEDNVNHEFSHNPTKKRSKHPSPCSEKPLSKRAKRSIQKQAKKKAQTQIREQIREKCLALEQKSTNLKLSNQTILLDLVEQLTTHKLSDKKFVTAFNQVKAAGVPIPKDVQIRFEQIKAKRSQQRVPEPEPEQEDVPQGTVVVPHSNHPPITLIAEAKQSPRSKEAVPDAEPLKEISSNAENAAESLPVLVNTRSWYGCLRREVVRRSTEIEKWRIMLPAYKMEQEIVDTCLNHPVTFVTGGTGSGKSTQIPQFLYEGGLSMTPEASLAAQDAPRLKIGITQPRRLAAIALANRVREEMPDHQNYVGYHVRHDKLLSSRQERIVFMTEGILMRILQGDFLLQDFSVIILDEIHERSTECDLLIGLLSRVRNLRQRLFDEFRTHLPPLRLVLMSATPRLCDFMNNPNLFETPPHHISIEAKLFPVTVHFNKTTPEDYLLEAKRRILQIHRKLPPGSILVFLTGRDEIIHLQQLLSKRPTKSTKTSNSKLSHTLVRTSFSNFGGLDDDEGSIDSGTEENDTVNDETDTSDIDATPPDSVYDSASDSEIDNGAEARQVRSGPTEFSLDGEEDDQANSNLAPSQNPAKTSEASGYGEDKDLDYFNIKDHQHTDWLGCGAEDKGGLRPVPLYANLPQAKQDDVFKLPSKEERMVILSTNIAETSLTLPNIRYVVDCGFIKRRVYSVTGGSSSFVVEKISKANADQRQGRAGRLGPGHCYRLYSSAVYQHEFPKFPPVQLLNAPLDSLLLYLTSLGLPSIENFPFPSPPSRSAIQAAINRLISFQLASRALKDSVNLQITQSGILAVQFATLPRYSIMILRALQAARKTSVYELPVLVILAVSCLTISSELYADKITLPKLAFEPVDDLERHLLLVLEAFHSKNKLHRSKFCDLVGINFARLVDVAVSAGQLVEILANSCCTEQEKEVLCQIFGIKHFNRSRFSFNLASKATDDELNAIFNVWSKITFESHMKRPLKLCVASGLIDRIAVRLQEISPIPQEKLTLFSQSELKRHRLSFRIEELPRSECAQIHKKSHLSFRRPLPSICLYNHTIASSKSNKVYMYDVILFDEWDILKNICGDQLQSELLMEWEKLNNFRIYPLSKKSPA